MRSFTTISRADVPTYLHVGGLYHSLDAEDEAGIEVPSSALKPDESLDNVDDLQRLLCSLSYWVVECIPEDALEFVLRSEAADVIPILDQFEHAFPKLTVLKAILSSPMPSTTVAIQCGSLEVLMFLHERLGNSLPDNSVDLAAEYGYLDCLIYCNKRQVQRSSHRACEAAVLKGHVEILKYLIDSKYPWRDDLLAEAAGYGQLECLQLLHKYRQQTERGRVIHPPVCLEAARNGHLDCLMFAHEVHYFWGENVCAEAAANGHLDCLIYLREHGCPWSEDVMQRAAYYGHLHCLVWAHEHGCLTYRHHCGILHAARGGHLDCMQYAAEISEGIVHIQDTSEWRSKVCAVAAQGGDPRCLSFAHKRGYPWNAEVCVIAAATGHVECLEYAINNGCPWSADDVAAAAIQGRYRSPFQNYFEPSARVPAPVDDRFRVLEYLLANKYSLCEKACITATMDGEPLFLAHLLKNACPYPADICALAARQGHMECLKVAHNHGCEWSAEVCKNAAIKGSVECLQYAHSSGCPWDAETCNQAAKNGHIECLKYAVEQGCPVGLAAMNNARLGGEFKCLQYLERLLKKKK